MLIEEAIGKISDDEYKNLTADFLNIDWYNAHKKIDRLHTEAGSDIGIRLTTTAMAKGLRDGDVVAVHENTAIVVNILPCDCLVMSVQDVHKLPKLCYEIGNRHAPFFYGNSHSEFVTPYDKPIMQMLEKIGVDVEVRNMKINLDHAISSTTGGAHSH